MKKIFSRRNFIKAMLGVSALVGAVSIGGGYYVNLPKFGAKAEGRRLDRVLSSPNWDGAKFENYEPIVNVVKSDKNEDGFLKAMMEIVSPTKGKGIPSNKIPAIKTDLKNLPQQGIHVVWFGHSSFFIQLNGKKILVDPVFSTYAAPIPFIVKAFDGTEIYSPEDIPDLDLLLISHDHWDHLDYPTVTSLRDKVKKVVCPLGVDGHLVSWGFREEQVQELDWYEYVDIEQDLRIHLTPSRHFSGRFLKRNQTLWGGFVIECGGRRIYYTGDGGFGRHFADIAKNFPDGMDLVMLENGQYDANWHDVHMFSEEAAEAAEIVGARAVIPVHAGKFNLCKSPWKMPYERLVKAYSEKKYHYKLLLPQIGEVTEIPSIKEFSCWWEEI